MVPVKKIIFNIPRYLLILFIPILFTAVIYFCTSLIVSGKMIEKIEVSVRRLDVLESTTVTDKEFNLIQKQLDRIETKLDHYIDKEKN